MKIHTVIASAAMVLAATASTAQAQANGPSAQSCRALVDTRITPTPFAEAAAQIGSVALTKDEFETTAAYQARVEAARANVPSSFIIPIELNKEHTVYNADAGKFTISASAFGRYGIDWFSAFYNSGTGITGTLSSQIGLVVESSETPTGTYEGQNAYGAKWDIVKIERRVDAIYQGAAPSYNIGLFGRDSFPPVSWDLPVPPENARSAKEAMRAAVVVAPTAPFYFENTQGSGGRITIQNPRDVTQVARVLVGDIQCVVITDDTNYVFLAIPTN